MSKLRIRPGQSTAATPVEENPIEVAVRTVHMCEFERDGILVPAFSFATATGQGTSSEVIPFDEFDDYLAVLQRARAEGVPEVESEDAPKVYVPTHVILDRELRLTDYVQDVKDAAGKVVKDSEGNVERINHGPRVMFRSRDGQGSKIHRIRPEHFNDLVSFVEQLADEREALMPEWEKALPTLIEDRAKAKAAAAEKARKAAEVAAAAKAKSQS